MKIAAMIFVGALFFLIGPFTVITKALSGDQVEIPFILYNVIMWTGILVPTFFLIQKWHAKTPEQQFMHVLIVCAIFFALESLSSIF